MLGDNSTPIYVPKNLNHMNLIELATPILCSRVNIAIKQVLLKSSFAHLHLLLLSFLIDISSSPESTSRDRQCGSMVKHKLNFKRELLVLNSCWEVCFRESCITRMSTRAFIPAKLTCERSWYQRRSRQFFGRFFFKGV
jgi:hypothetical protein